MSNGRELSISERRDIRELVTKMCANYDCTYKECLPLEGTCYMFGRCFTDSGMCKYFKEAVLPLNPSLERIFSSCSTNTATLCPICGEGFVSVGNKMYCSGLCSEKARKKATAKRVKKYRENKRSDVTLSHF